MGKKKGGKKKGKGKASGGGKKGKKSAQREDQMTMKEAVMALEIQTKEKAVEDMMFEIKGLQEKNKRHQARNVRLKEEQEIHIKVLLRQAKEQEEDSDKKEVFTCEHVEKAMKELWATGRSEDQQIKELEEKIEITGREYEDVLGQVEMWREYRDNGAKQHSDQIQLLQMELEDMNKNFEDVCAHLKRQLDVAKAEVKTHMEQCMAEQQFLASEKAMNQMDKQGVQEIHENEWLKKEADIHRKEVASLCKMVEELERENIQLISELVDCHADDLKISRTFANVPFDEENDDLMDRKMMSIYEPEYASPASTPARAITSATERPKSARLAAIEDKVFSIKIQEQSDDEAESDKEDNNMLAQVEEDNILKQQEYLHLGPLELKLLCVKGETKPIHSLDSSIQIVDGTSSEITVTRPKWPISTPMLKSVKSPQ